MNEFPNHLKPSNIDNFKNYLFEHNLNHLRQNLYLFLLSRDDNFFSLESIRFPDREKAINIVIKELKDLGWYLAKVFGDTGLIIKSSEDDIKNSMWSSSLDLEFC